ncbi:uncharacterized protein PV07_08382 [Cladophialophora immunda]|uniref:Carboxylesterase type B domain-containing protein n=1 Tax=Cladophialophora immunda TaxID=569365 RepID=A0A0D2CYT7_9EURO|nr:uncharacterized protein PV07_08382 [Cladophialophora immunda]KIW28744.1 hypothetical protein PV07_08382 [Cladophialophora immunda]OQV11337.1 hypothetical protein CLAIMM_15189 [Cladophialophora immunda]
MFKARTSSRRLMGPVQGFVDDGMQKFLGMPYAAPPVGSLRWQPPTEPEPWDRPLEARRFGSVCAQSTTCFPGFGSNGGSEDCLYLNVFRPVKDYHTHKGKHPVMVWIHGGGFASGASNDYNPASLVKDGDVVFVSFNYRVGCFGFFSHPAINREGHLAGNYGIMDQQLAMVWVRRNISQFGGDVTNITCMGQSAGGASLLAHMTMPSSRGLFHKAIIESGGSPPAMTFPTIEKLETIGIALASAAGCTEQGQTSEKLRLIPTADLMAADEIEEGVFGISRFPFGLMEDGSLVPRNLRGRFSRGDFHHIPVLIGVNADEFTWFQAMIELRSGRIVPANNYFETVATTIDLLNKLHLNGIVIPESAIPDIVSLYPIPAAVNSNPSRALAAVVGDAGLISTAGRRTVRLLAAYCPEVYTYEFDVPDTPCPWPEVSFPYGSAHTLELPYIFLGFSGGAGEAKSLSGCQLALSKLMVYYWTSFARRGTPNGDASPQVQHTAPTAQDNKPPKWEIYTPHDDNVMLFQAAKPSRMIKGWGRRHNSDFWDTFY